MGFGEIVEPSTRALVIDDDEEFVDYPLSYQFSLEWEGTKVVPNVINSLILVESAHVERFFSKDFLTGRFYAEIKNAEVKIYALDSNNYLIIANVSEKFTHGELVVNLIPWIETAINVYCVTSKPLPLYVNYRSLENSDTIVRSLVYKGATDLGYSKLESPNLATGMAAAVMSFCAYKDKACALFIIFVSSAPLDLISAKPISELLVKLKVIKEGEYKINVNIPCSNLYM